MSTRVGGALLGPAGHDAAAVYGERNAGARYSPVPGRVSARSRRAAALSDARGPARDDDRAAHGCRAGCRATCAARMRRSVERRRAARLAGAGATVAV